MLYKDENDFLSQYLTKEVDAVTGMPMLVLKINDQTRTWQDTPEERQMLRKCVHQYLLKISKA